MTQDYFADRASTFDQGAHRVRNVDHIAHAICQRIHLTQDMTIMDFGAGTGLLLERIAPQVAHLIAVDTSPAMLAELTTKRPQLGSELTCITADITSDSQALDSWVGQLDGIVSSMALHHVKHTQTLLREFYRLLKPTGFIALADLDKEDGGFHGDRATNAAKGVQHFGFDRTALQQLAESVGFGSVDFITANTLQRPQGDFPVFLLTATKNHREAHYDQPTP